MNQKTLLTACICACLFLGYRNCRAQASSNIVLLQVKGEIEKNNMVYFKLFATKNLCIIDLYTDDASLLAPNMPPIMGKKSLKKDFEDTFVAGKVKGVKFQTTGIYGDGKTYVTEEGNWQVFNPNGKVLDDGKYLKLWKLTKTGWKIFRDCFNSNHK